MASEFEKRENLKRVLYNDLSPYLNKGTIDTLVYLFDTGDVENNLNNSRIFDSISERDSFFNTLNENNVYNYSYLKEGLLIAVNDEGITKFYKWTGDTFPTTYDNLKWVITSFRADIIYSSPSSLQVGNEDIYSGADHLGVLDLNTGNRQILTSQQYNYTNALNLKRISLTSRTFIDRQLLFNEIQPVTPYTYSFLFPSNEGVKLWSGLELYPANSGEFIFEVRKVSVNNPLIVREIIAISEDDVINPAHPRYNLKNNVRLNPNDTIVITLSGDVSLYGTTINNIWYPYFKAGEQVMTFEDVATESWVNNLGITTHIQNNDIHVTTNDKSNWNGKQNALGFTPENILNKGQINGYAELDNSGKVPMTQLPPYLVLGETSLTAHRGDRGKIAYDHSQATGNQHNTSHNDLNNRDAAGNHDKIKPAVDSRTAFQVTKNNDTPVLNVDTLGGNIGIGTTDLDETPSTGKITIKGDTVNGSTNIIVGRNSNEENVFSVDTFGGIFGYLLSFDLTKDPTGFIDKNNIGVSYDKVARTMILSHNSGEILYLFRGRLKKLISPWTSPAHIAGTINYYLKSIDGDNFIWEPTVWDFTDIQIAIARYAPSTAEYYGIRECHGIMPHDDHEEAHDNIGTYRTSGLTIDNNSILINPANISVTNAGNRPIVTSGVIKDEDLETFIPQWLDNDVYSVLYFDASNNSQLTYTSLDIYLYNSGNNVLRYNPVGQGLVDVSNGHYINMYCLHVPVTSDTSSQKYRNVWIVGQNQYSTLTSAQAEDPRSINYGNITGAIPEQVIYAVITFQYLNAISSANALGKCKIAADPRYITGSRISTISAQSFNVSHNSTLDRDVAGNHAKLVPATNSPTAIRVMNSDESLALMTFDTSNNRVLLSNVPEYTDNTAAVNAGLLIGSIYRTGDILKIVRS